VCVRRSGASEASEEARGNANASAGAWQRGRRRHGGAKREHGGRRRVQAGGGGAASAGAEVVLYGALVAHRARRRALPRRRAAAWRLRAAPPLGGVRRGRGGRAGLVGTRAEPRQSVLTHAFANRPGREAARRAARVRTGGACGGGAARAGGDSGGEQAPGTRSCRSVGAETASFRTWTGVPYWCRKGRGAAVARAATAAGAQLARAHPAARARQSSATGNRPLGVLSRNQCPRPRGRAPARPPAALPRRARRRVSTAPGPARARGSAQKARGARTRAPWKNASSWAALGAPVRGRRGAGSADSAPLGSAGSALPAPIWAASLRSRAIALRVSVCLCWHPAPKRRAPPAGAA
jgi:hypothetical protein